MNSIFTRRSVRKFLPRAVEPEKIDRILRAAMQAPSATNQQPWEFLVVDDRQLIDRLSQFSRYSKLLLGAPLAVVALERTGLRARTFVPQDMGACVENLMLQAVEEGLGSVWMGVGGGERRQFINDMFSLPRTVEPFAVIAVGYPEEENANHFTDRYEEERVHFNKY